MNYLKNKNFKALIITLIVVLTVSVLSLGENSVISSAINSFTKGLFQVSASATASADTATYEELKSENEKLRQENAQLREQLVDYYDTKTENEKLWKYYELKSENGEPRYLRLYDDESDIYELWIVDDFGEIESVYSNGPF